jgi:signal transduction histidine kinase
LVDRLRHPQTTVRWRLTALYGGLFLICGAGLLAVTYALVAHATGSPQVSFIGGTGIRNDGPNAVFTRTAGAVPPALKQVLHSPSGRAAVRFVGDRQRVADLHQLEIESSIALAVMAILSGLLGWMVAGRVLRPLRTITATTQRLSEANLHERLSLAGPRDELRTLADTIDGLLARLESAFNAQRRFVTNASHELRTPLAASRALLEMAVSDPGATVSSLRAACRDALEEGEQQEQLIDALLALAQGERGLDVQEPVNLAALAREVQRVYEPEALIEGIVLQVEAQAAEVIGDRRLLGRLVSNLVENAIRHNVPDGRASLDVHQHPAGARLTVSNTGPVVPAAEIPRLLQPFQRIAPDRITHHEGFGLGLSIIAAVATAHDASLEIRPRGAGGLHVELRFPPARGSTRFAAALSSHATDGAEDDRAPGAGGHVEAKPQVGIG